MADWIKLSTAMFDNRKIKQIEVVPKGKQMLLLWVRLICLAGAINDGGLIYVTAGVPYTLEGLAVELNESRALVKKALDTFQAYGMVEYDENGCLFLSGWEEHQNVTGLERIKEQNRERKRQQRARDKSRDSHAEVTDEKDNSHAMSRDSHAEVTQQNKNKSKNKNKSTSSSGSSKSYGSYGASVTDTTTTAAKEAIVFWFTNTGRENDVIRSDIADLVERYGQDVAMAALREAIRANVYKIPYAASIAERMASGEGRRKGQQEYIDPFEAVFGKGSKGDGENGSN